MVVGNTLRSPRHFILSAFGIVIGIATFVIFLASTEQVAAVLEKIFPLEQVDVIAPHASLLGKDISKKLDDDIVKKIKQRPEVLDALPRMSLTFPAAGRGDFEDNDLKFEVGGFSDGIDPGFVNDDDRTRELFKDWDSDTTDKHRIACVPPSGDHDGEMVQSPPAPPTDHPPVPGKYYNPCPDPDRYYCDDSDRTCHHRVPVVMSPTMIELYNNQFAKSHGLPIADADIVKFITQRGGLSAMRFSIGLGLTTIAGTNTSLNHKPRRVEAVLIGISHKAMPIGMTIPIQYIQRWNTEFAGKEAGTTYSKIVVTLKDRNKLAPLQSWLESELDLRIEDSLGAKFATVVFIVRVVLVVISLVIIAISAINISHNFFMQVTERRRELGLLRALGATQMDVLFVVLGEAVLIGLIGGILGVLLGLGIAQFIDWMSSSQLPPFPYKPDTWFHFSWWIWTGGLACSAVFAVFGGYLPARRASTMEPAQALTQN
jgi:ABC-type lipoprotein release transport system permease subunit